MDWDNNKAVNFNVVSFYKSQNPGAVYLKMAQPVLNEILSLRCWSCPSLINYIEILRLSLLLKFYLTKLKC